jgi:hypothetical protein
VHEEGEERQILLMISLMLTLLTVMILIDWIVCMLLHEAKAVV